jgi:hypothetical protein
MKTAEDDLILIKPNFADKTLVNDQITTINGKMKTFEDNQKINTD